MVLPLLGDSQIFETLGQKLGLKGYKFAQVITFEHPPMLLSEEPLEAQNAIGAVVCVPESILIDKRNVSVASTLKWHKQTIPNTCGSVALLNLSLNLNPIVRDISDSLLLMIHEDSVGTTTTEEEQEDVEMHFVALLKTPSNDVYELDGRNPHGIRKLSSNDLIEAIKGEYMAMTNGMMSVFLLFKE